MLTIFASTTLEGWTGVMYQLSLATNVVYTSVFFLLLTMIGGFVVTNLMLATVKNKFSQASRREEADMARQSLHVAAEKSLIFKINLSLIKLKNLLHSSSCSKYHDRSQFLRQLRRMTQHPVFDYTFFCFILLNTVMLAMEHYNMPSEMKSVLDVFNEVLAIAFSVEVIWKMTAFGVVTYLGDKMNFLDFFIVAAGLAEVVISHAGGSDELDILRVVRVFRVLRVLRVAKLLKYFASLREIVDTLAASIPSFVYIAGLLFLLMFIYTVMGVQLFGGRFFEGAELSNDTIKQKSTSRANFDDLWWAFVTAFQVMQLRCADSSLLLLISVQILTLEDWVAVMIDGMRFTGDFAFLYFASFIVLGNYILLNLFLAVLLENERMTSQVKKTNKTSRLKNISSRIKAGLSMIKRRASRSAIVPTNVEEENSQDCQNNYTDMTAQKVGVSGRNTGEDKR